MVGVGHAQGFGSGATGPLGPGNGGPPRSPQMEPVDFSGPPRPLGFGLVGHITGPRPYSRESTPDSGGSHYIETYRDPSGECAFNLIKNHLVYRYISIEMMFFV